MSCGSTKFTEGETIKGSVIEDSHVRDSVLNRVEIISPNLQGPVTLDDEAIASLTAVLLAALQGQPVEVDLARLAATFTNCQGLPLIPGVKIATCQDLTDALAASCCGQGGAGDTISEVTFDPVTRTLTIVTSSQTWTVVVPEGDAIVDVTFDPATRDLTVTSASQEWVVNIPGGGGGETVTDLAFVPGTQELTLTVIREDGTEEALTTEIPGGAGGDTVTGVTFDPDTRELTVAVETDDGSPVEFGTNIPPADYKSEEITALQFETNSRDLTLSLVRQDGTPEVLTANIPGAGSGGDVVNTLTFDSTTQNLVLNITKADGTREDLAALLTGLGGDTITNVTYDETTHMLVITVVHDDGTTEDISVEISNAGEVVTGLAFDTDTRELVLTVEKADGTPGEWKTTVPAAAGGDVVEGLVFEETSRELTLSLTKADGAPETLTVVLPENGIDEDCYIHCYTVDKDFTAGQLARINDRVYYCLQDNGPGTEAGVVDPAKDQPKVTDVSDGGENFDVWTDNIPVYPFGYSLQDVALNMTTGRRITVMYNTIWAEVRDDYGRGELVYRHSGRGQASKDGMSSLAVDWDSGQVVIVDTFGSIWLVTDAGAGEWVEHATGITEKFYTLSVDWTTRRMVVAGANGGVYTFADYLNPVDYEIQASGIGFDIYRMDIDWTTGRTIAISLSGEIATNAAYGVGAWTVQGFSAPDGLRRILADWTTGRIIVYGAGVYRNDTFGEGAWQEVSAQFPLNYGSILINWTTNQALVVTEERVWYTADCDAAAIVWEQKYELDFVWQGISIATCFGFVDWEKKRVAFFDIAKEVISGLADTQLVEWNPYWKEYDSAPVGTLDSFVGKYIPRDYLPTDGSTILRADYPALTEWALLSGNAVPQEDWDARPYMFGLGDGSTTLTLPYQPAMLGNTLYGIKAR